MRTSLVRPLHPVLLALLLFVVAAAPSWADGPELVAADADRVAIQGYDTVAYFTDGKALKGSGEYEYAWGDAAWWFASAAHRDMFAADPDRYMPQFGGFCAGAVVEGVLVRANPEAWTIVAGKLYMIAGTPEDIAAWRNRATENIEQADKQWPTVQGRAAAQNK